MPVSHGHVEDKIVWKQAKDGDYTVRSAYTFFKNNDNTHGALPVAGEFKKRGVSIDKNIALRLSQNYFGLAGS